jgi:hypothetical protein
VLRRGQDQVPRPRVLDEPAAEPELELAEPVPRMPRVGGGGHAPEVDVPAAGGVGGPHRGPQRHVHRLQLGAGPGAAAEQVVGAAVMPGDEHGGERLAAVARDVDAASGQPFQQGPEVRLAGQADAGPRRAARDLPSQLARVGALLHLHTAAQRQADVVAGPVAQRREHRRLVAQRDDQRVRRLHLPGPPEAEPLEHRPSLGPDLRLDPQAGHPVRAAPRPQLLQQRRARAHGTARHVRPAQPARALHQHGDRAAGAGDQPLQPPAGGRLDLAPGPGLGEGRRPLAPGQLLVPLHGRHARRRPFGRRKPGVCRSRARLTQRKWRPHDRRTRYG